MMYAFGPFRLDADERRLSRGGQQLRLQPKPWEALLYLVQHPGRLISKDELLAELWSGQVVTENALTRCIMEVRKALGDAADRSDYIETVPKAGYRFIAPVQQIPMEQAQPPENARASNSADSGDRQPSHAPAPITHSTATDSHHAEAATKPPEAPQWPRPFARMAIAVAATMLLVMLAVVVAWNTRSPEAGPVVAGTLRHGLAIEPLDHRTADDTYQLVLQGLATSIGARLASSGDVLVTTDPSGGRAESASEVALSADRWLLQGVFDEDRNSQFVDLKLTSGNERTLLQQRYRLDHGDLVGLEQRIADDVAAVMGLELPPQPTYLATAASVDSITAQQLYLMGRGLVSQRQPADIQQAIALFHQTLDLKPDHAGAMAALAIAYILSPDEYYPQGVAADRAALLLNQALDIDPMLALGYAGRGLLMLNTDNSTSQARPLLEKALQLNPGEIDALVWLANVASSEGRVDEAFRLFSRALQVEPRHSSVNGNLAFNLARQGRLDQALALLDSADELLDGNPGLVYFKVSLLRRSGRLTEALETISDAVVAYPEGQYFQRMLAQVYANLGLQQPATWWTRQHASTPPDDEQGLAGELENHITLNDAPAIESLLGKLDTHPMNFGADCRDRGMPRTDRPTATPHWMLVLYARAHAWLGNDDKALACLQTVLPNADAISGHGGSFTEPADLAHWLAYYLQKQGRPEQASAYLDRVAGELSFMQAHGVKQSLTDLESEAFNLALANRPEEALDVLSQMVELGWSQLASLQHDPRWEVLRGYPAFNRLMHVISKRLDAMREQVVSQGQPEALIQAWQKASQQATSDQQP